MGNAGRINLYTCDCCNKQAMILDFEDGTLPSMVQCPETKKCGGMAHIQDGPVDQSLRPIWEWGRRKDGSFILAKRDRLTPFEKEWVTMNMGIAGNVAKYLASKNRIDFSELQAASYYGLCNSAKTYDPTKGAKRVTHAWWTCYWTVKSRINEMTGRTARGNKKGVPATNFTDIPRDGDEWKFDPPERRPEEGIYRISDIEGLHEAISRLPDRQNRIIRMRMDGISLEQVGMKIGVSKERIRQIEAESIEAITRIMCPTGRTP